MRRVLVSSLLVLALVAAVSASGDQQVRFPRADGSTDDAFVRADITPLSARVEGQVREVLVRDNQAVRAGQVLVRLDDRELRARLEEANARAAITRARLDALGARGRALGAGLEAARAEDSLAKAADAHSSHEADRLRRLAEQGLSTTQERERVEFEAARDAAALQRQAATVKRVAADVQGLAPERAQLEAELAEHLAQARWAELQVGFTTIVAPSAGVVGERQVRVGQLVRVGTPVINLVALDEVWVTANFKERDLAGLEEGRCVEVVVDRFPDQPMLGTIDSLAPASGAQFSVLPPDNATGNFTKIAQRVPVKVSLSVPPALMGRLLPGMSATVSLGPLPTSVAPQGALLRPLPTGVAPQEASLRPLPTGVAPQGASLRTGARR